MIQVKNLHYTYPKNTEPTINGISFSIEKGEVFGFLGPSGSGKSTTQKILFRLLNGYSGEITIENKALTYWGKELYEKIGVGFELPNHYLKLTALENLSFFSAFYGKQKYSPLELLAKVGLEKEANKKVGDFSKGMKMRLNFVRSFMHDPDILFLDEPTSGLDPVNAAIIKQIIKELQEEGKTIFITTHQMHDADELCNKVAFIVQGEIKAIGEPSALKLAHSSRKVCVKYGAETINESLFSLDNLGQNKDFLQLLVQEKIQSIHSQEASLDDIFITVTGKTLI